MSKHRWWGGWDIGRRLPFVVIGYFIVLARPSLVLVSLIVILSIPACYTVQKKEPLWRIWSQKAPELPLDLTLILILSHTHTQFFMSLAALVALILHLFVKPYENKYINIIEAAILLNLLMVTAAFLDPSNSPVPEWFSTMLLILPYVYAVGYFGYLIAKYLWSVSFRLSCIRSCLGLGGLCMPA